MKKLSLALLIMTFFGALIAWRVIINRRQNNNDGPLFAYEKSSKQTITQYIHATGTLKAKNQFTVGSLLAGRIIELHADDNDVVKKNQLLAKIDNGVDLTAVKRTQGALDEAKAIATYQEKWYHRQKKLFESGQLSQSLFDQYTKDYQVALANVIQREADLEREKINYENLFIRSPDDGIVIDRKVELAQMITSQLQASVLFEIAHDLADMEAWVDVDEADVGRVTAGQETQFSVDAFAKKRFFAQVAYVQYQARIVDNVITYPTVLRVKNPDLALRPGMTVNVDIKVAHKENVCALPNKAFRINGYKLETSAKEKDYTIVKEPDPAGDPSVIYDYIWLVQDKTLTKKPVQTGARDAHYTEIISTLADDAQIITELYDIKSNNPFLKNMFKQPGSIGS